MAALVLVAVGMGIVPVLTWMAVPVVRGKKVKWLLPWGLPL